MTKRIIRRMKQILNMYRMVKTTQKSIDVIDKMATKHLVKHERRDRLEHTFRPAASAVKSSYVEKYRRTSFIKTNDICVDAIENGYLVAGVTSDPNGAKLDGITEIDNLGITTKGRELIDKAWIIPIGLWLVWWDKFGVFVSGFIVGILLPAVFFLIKWLIP